MRLSNLPPGVSDLDIEEAQGPVTQAQENAAHNHGMPDYMQPETCHKCAAIVNAIVGFIHNLAPAN